MQGSARHKRQVRAEAKSLAAHIFAEAGARRPMRIGRHRGPGSYARLVAKMPNVFASMRRFGQNVRPLNRFGRN
jgi:hypothetical protein